MKKDVIKTINQLNAPLLYSFSKYVLDTAQQCGCGRIYFLARDGYEPYIFSKRIAKTYRYSVECRYLFSSRLAWRLACYARLPDEEVLRLVFSPSLFLTPDMILERIRATPQQKEALLAGTGVCRYDLLNAEQCRHLRKALEKNKTFWNIVRENSEAALEMTLKYFRQEGLLDIDFAICDSGWSGSMQRCLKLILEEQGIKHSVHGIYFGLYTCPKKLERCVNAYCFLPEQKFFRKAKFNNNLLEAIFVSPHGMTIGYKEEGGRILPILKSERAEWFKEDHACLQKWLDEHLAADEGTMESAIRDEKVKKQLIKTMYKPGQEELSCYARYLFSDDPSEGRRESIVQLLTKEEARKFLVFNRLRSKVNAKKRGPTPNVYWLYGSIQASDLKHKYWYRWNCFFWEAMRLVRIRCKFSG